jgi:hypothetical protein
MELLEWDGYQRFFQKPRGGFVAQPRVASKASYPGTNRDQPLHFLAMRGERSEHLEFHFPARYADIGNSQATGC